MSHFKATFFNFLDWVTKQGQTTWLAVTLHSSPAFRQTSQGHEAVFHRMRSIAFVIYAMRFFFNHLMYFVLEENPCILLKLKRENFLSFLELFYMFIISPPPSPEPQSFVHLAFQYSPLPFLPFSSQCSWNQTAFYILY